MTAWIDPNLLQLVGMGAKDDLYTPDGHHLRWFFGRLLGFPRTGFRLRRSESPITPERWKTVAGAPGVARTQVLSTAQVGPFTHRFDNGLTVSKAGGISYQTIDPGTAQYVTVDSDPLVLGFGHEGPSITPPAGPSGSNPAAWIRLTVLRRKHTGLVSARAYADGRNGTNEFLSSAFVGVGLVSPVAWREAAAAEWRWIDPRPAMVVRPGLPSRARANNPWVAETMLLHGGLIERVEVIGRDAAVMQVDWFPTRAYDAATQLWADVDTFFLPLTDAAPIYPAWTTDSGVEVAKTRLMTGTPHALPPWDEPVYPPPPPPPGAVEDDLARRYLDPGYERMAEAMKLFLDGELSGDRPQALVTVDETLEAEPADESFDSGTMQMFPFDLLMGSSVDPHVARLLGLLTTDTKALDVTWDYVVEAGFASKWLLLTILVALSSIPADDVDADDLRDMFEVLPAIAGLTKLREQDMRPEQVISMATAVAAVKRPPADAPADLTATATPVPARRPTEAEVALRWRANEENLFAAPEGNRVFYAVRRVDESGGDEPLHPKDDESGVLLPHVPTRSVVQNGRVGLRDDAVPRYGSYRWRVSGMDLWGRFSPFAEVEAAVVDLVPPPAPAALRATLLGPETAAPAWGTFRLTFDWSEGAMAAAADLAHFEVHVRQGPVSPSDADVPGLWGHTQHVPGAIAGPLIVGWPSGDVIAPAGVPASATIVTLPPGEGGGRRITVEIGPVVVPFDAGGLATIAATVRAVDTTGNSSSFARPAVATRADMSPPPPPPPSGVLAYGTRRDFLGRSSFRIALGAPTGGTVQVVRCPAVALLAAAAVDDATFAAQSETERVNLLQGLATQHQELFALDHPAPYPASATAHLVALNGNDRSWTLATTVGLSRTGVRERWPADPLRFHVIAVPRPPAPPQPVVVEARGGDRSATLRINPDPTGASAELRVYRTRAMDAAADVRLMRPVATLPASTGPTVFDDTGLFADVAYMYRVLAVGEGGERSEPTSPMTVVPFTTEPPTPPTVKSVQKTGDPTRRSVDLRLARRDHAIALLRRRHGTPWFAPAETLASRPDGTLDLGLLTPTIDNGEYTYTVEDHVTDGAARWGYRIRVTDAQGRVATSPTVEEVP